MVQVCLSKVDIMQYQNTLSLILLLFNSHSLANSHRSSLLATFTRADEWDVWFFKSKLYFVVKSSNWSKVLISFGIIASMWNFIV